MHQLAVAMDELRQFYLVGICLFFLIVPLIILIIKSIKYYIALYDVKVATSNETLDKGILYIFVSLAISLFSGVMTSTGAWSTILFIGTLAFTYFGFTKIEEWCEEQYKVSKSSNFLAMQKGFYNLKVASLLQVIIIGFFMMPSALEDTSRAIFNEYGNKPMHAATTSQSYGYTAQPAQAPQNYYGQPQPNTSIPAVKAVETEVAKPKSPGNFCPFCGGALPEPDAKFCASCGNRL